MAKLKVELGGYFLVENGIVPRHEELLQQLSYNECLSYPTQLYRKLTSEMLTCAHQGQYQLTQYITVFHYATRFENLLGCNIDNLKRRIIKGIAKGHYVYHDYLADYLSVGERADFRQEMLEIRNYCLEVNESVREKEKQQNIYSLFKEMASDFDTFIEKMRSSENLYFFSPFWSVLGARKTMTVINKLENDQIWKLGHYFDARYRQHMYSSLRDEKVFVTQLHQLIDAPKRRKRKNLRNVSLNYLSAVLRESETAFPD